MDGQHTSTSGAVWSCPMHPDIREAHPGKCPICGMTFQPMSSPDTMEPKKGMGHDQAIHDMACHDQNRHAPQTAAWPPTGGHTIWTCPMRPQIRQDHPGNCALCGIALEAEEPTEQPDDNSELKDFTHRLIVAPALAIPLTVVTNALRLGALRTRTMLVPYSWSAISLI